MSESKDTIYKTLCYRYDMSKTYSTIQNLYKKHAKKLQLDELDKYWLFIYEVLPYTLQKDNFIKSLSTHKYKYLFDDLVVQEINIILANLSFLFALAL